MRLMSATVITVLNIAIFSVGIIEYFVLAYRAGFFYLPNSILLQGNMKKFAY